MPDTIGAVVLAAGFSNRYGSSKLQARLSNGKTVFQQTLERIIAAIPRVYVISRPEIAPLLLEYHPQIASFEQADHGMGASLAFAMSKLSTWDGCLVCLADMPFIESESYRKIADALHSDNIVIPTFNSQTGNPVAFGQYYFKQLRALKGDVGGRDIVRSVAKNSPELLIKLELEDAGIIQDVDTPEDLSRYQ